jgi:hypothetical protein
MRVSAPKELLCNLFGSKRPVSTHPEGHRLEKMRLRRGSCSVSVLQLIESLA